MSNKPEEQKVETIEVPAPPLENPEVPKGEKKPTAAELREAEERHQAEVAARGYYERTNALGIREFVSVHDQWTSPDEVVMQEHVNDYRAKVRMFVG